MQRFCILAMLLMYHISEMLPSIIYTAVNVSLITTLGMDRLAFEKVNNFDFSTA